MRLSFLVLLCLAPFTCLSNSFAAAANFTGRVVGVIDGDTIDVLHNGQAERIRLNGIDCPEKGQPFGKKAKQFTSSLVYGMDVTIKTHRRDRHGRTIGDVILTDGSNLSGSLSRQATRGGIGNIRRMRRLLLLSRRRERKSGLWSDPHAIPPWEVRHPKKQLDSVMSADLLIPEHSSKKADTTAVLIIGNRDSHRYHRPDCPGYRQRNRRTVECSIVKLKQKRRGIDELDCPEGTHRLGSRE
jgi:micrococcal nuclease